MTRIRSIGAVLAGILVGAVLSIGTDAVLEALGVFPSGGLFIPWMLGLALLYRGLYTVLSGYVTARLAPENPMRHAIILGCVGVLASAAGTVAGWDLSQHWYPIALTLITLPCTWLGGRLFTRS